MAFEKLVRHKPRIGMYVSIGNYKGGDRRYTIIRISKELIEKLEWDLTKSVEVFVDREAGKVMLQPDGAYALGKAGWAKNVRIQKLWKDHKTAERCNWEIVDGNLIVEFPQWAKDSLKNQQKK